MGHNMKNLKKRKVVAAPKVEEINFDPESRQEWLTGFHKRKVQRAKQAQENAAKQYKEDKRAMRAKIREERKKDFEQAMDEHSKVLQRMKEDAGDISDEKEEEDEDDWNGIEEPPAVDYEAEYIDEDKYTTVTVEEMDASREGLLKSAHEYDTDTEEKEQKPTETKDADTKTAKKRKPRSAASEAARKKKRNFRYESKDVRRETMRKQRNVKSKKAKARKDKET
ncbi:Protein required for cell viability Rrp17 [Penicillium soppii]|uniref:Protein required for cell viability Rrp17 n=1 Tax=Penicillium soppii TaxID=69789 RepID=UPI00254781A0|nr:Protein required for cell viability Rrp17 [Penicillium soppii]KAJ5872556.1 Protein required for cell viability Rrp17 [Penicillium soppii]